MLVSIEVREVLDPDVETIDPAATVREVARRLVDEDADAVVAMADGEAVGIVSKTDVTRCLARDADADAIAVSDVMTSPVETIAASAAIEDAAQMLRSLDVQQLPVVEDGALVGVVTDEILSAYLPRLALEAMERGPERRRHRTDSGPGLLYEDVEWDTEFQCDDPECVTPGDVVTFSKPLTDQDVFDFASATGDTNRLHLDEAYAAGTRFGGRIAHGVLTIGLVSAALARLPGLVIYVSQQASFSGPVAIGERVEAECRVLESLGGDRYRLETTVTDAEGAVVLDGEATVLVDDLPEHERAPREARAAR